MLEHIPAEDNLYDEMGRVKDVDAAEEMAEFDQYYHDIDAGRFFRPSKRELANREADLEAVGRQTLEEKKREREIHLEWQLQQQAELARQEEFIARKLQQGGLSQEAWLALSADDQQRMEEGWRRREQQSPEWRLEQRLKSLVGRKVISFEVGHLGCVSVRFDDGSVLSFQSWNARDDDADYDGVEVRQERV